MKLRSLAGSTALAFSLSATSVLAAVTPEDVWQAWQDTGFGLGSAITSDSAVRDGDSLVVSNLALGNGTGLDVTLQTVTFTDNGDGTVSVTLPDSFVVKMTIPATAGDTTTQPGTVSAQVAMPGATIAASGTPEAIVYDTDAPEVDVTFDGLNAANPTATATLEAKLSGVQVHSEMAGGQAESYQEDLSAKSVVITAKGADPASATDYTLLANLADFFTTAKGSAPKGSAADSFGVALAKGLTLTSQFGMGASTFDLTSTQNGTATQISGSLKDGMVDLGADADKVSYYHNFNGLAVTIASPDLPMAKAAIGLGQGELHLVVPVRKTEAPADFTFLLNMTDLSLADDIWAMIDPSKALNHDPATLVVDTFGQVTLAQDLTADAAALTQANPAAAGQLNALEVPNIHLKAGGADLTAQGGFTFDNSDMTTFAGIPAPTGKIDIKATGVNALVDALVTMGILGKDQADQGRMMLAMFATTSATADELTSTLEVKDKHFFANGQQLR